MPSKSRNSDAAAVKDLDNWNANRASPRERFHLDFSKVSPLDTPKKVCVFKPKKTRSGKKSIISTHYESSDKMARQQLPILNVQKKMLEVAQLRMKSEVDGLRSAFRNANPDELGFASKNDFKYQLANEFAITTQEADTLCNLLKSRDNNVHRNDVLSLLNRLDRQTESTILPTAGRRKYDPTIDPDRPSHWGDSPIVEKPKLKRNEYSALAPADQALFKDVQLMSSVIEKVGPSLQKHFKSRKSNRSSFTIETKQSGDNIAALMQQHGLDISPSRVKAVLGADAMTFSQMVQRTTDVFNTVVQPIEVVSETTRCREHAGQYFGCRQSSNHSSYVGADGLAQNHPSGKRHVSKPGFLDHNMSPYDVQPRFRKLSVKTNFDAVPAGLCSPSQAIKLVRHAPLEPVSSKATKFESKSFDYSKSRWEDKVIKKRSRFKGRSRLPAADIVKNDMRSLIASSSFVKQQRSLVPRNLPPISQPPFALSC